MTKELLEVVGIELGARSYDIHIGTGLLAHAPRLLQSVLRRPNVIVVTDRTVADLYLEPLSQHLRADGVENQSLVLPAGEASKSFAQLEVLIGQLLDAGVERGDTIVALGGGVIGDLTGFAAAVLRRGVDFDHVVSGRAIGALKDVVPDQLKDPAAAAAAW